MFGKAVIPANPKTWEEKGEILQSMEEEIKTGVAVGREFYISCNGDYHFTSLMDF